MLNTILNSLVWYLYMFLYYYNWNIIPIIIIANLNWILLLSHLKDQRNDIFLLHIQDRTQITVKYKLYRQKRRKLNVWNKYFLFTESRNIIKHDILELSTNELNWNQIYVYLSECSLDKMHILRFGLINFNSSHN